MSDQLGPEIKRLRIAAGYVTLRGFATLLGVSAAHQSDIEHGRRMPSDELLRKIAGLLSKVGGSYEHLRALDARNDPDVQMWTQRHPEVATMLREIRQSGQSPREVLAKLQQMLSSDKKHETSVSNEKNDDTTKSSDTQKS
jgi:transcriptional regulator with XRE-family HTH domain